MKGEFIELTNGLKFAVISTHELDGEKYLYLASVTEDVKFVFAKIVSEKIIKPVEDEAIIVKLANQVMEKIENIK